MTHTGPFHGVGFSSSPVLFSACWLRRQEPTRMDWSPTTIHRLRCLSKARFKRGLSVFLPCYSMLGPLQTSSLFCVHDYLCSWHQGCYVKHYFYLKKFWGRHTASFPVSACPVTSCWNLVSFYNTTNIVGSGVLLLFSCFGCGILQECPSRWQ